MYFYLKRERILKNPISIAGVVTLDNVEADGFAIGSVDDRVDLIGGQNVQRCARSCNTTVCRRKRSRLEDIGSKLAGLELG